MCLLASNVTTEEREVDKENISLSTEDGEWQRLVKLYNIQPLSEAGYIGCGIYLLLIGCVATLGNSTVIHVLFKFKQTRKNPQNLLILNLSVSDLGISVFGYPLTTASCFARKFLFGEIGCMLQGFTTFTLALVAMKTMTCLSVYRYINICKPQHKWRLTPELTKKVIGGLWGYALLWTSLPFLGFSSYIFEPFGTSCSVNWTLKSCPGIFYTHCLIIFCYVINIVIIAFCYLKVIAKTNELSKRIKASRGITYNIIQALEARRMSQERRVTVISMTMVISFAVIWFPYSFLSLLVIYGIPLPPAFTTLPTMFCKSSCMLNPVIYSLFNSEFRGYIGRILRRKHQVAAELERRQTVRKFSMDKNHEGIYIGGGTVTVQRERKLLF